jgi:hypothetical protein
MKAKHPIWLVLEGEDGPGKHKLESYSDGELWDDDTGLCLIPIPGTDMELSIGDSDDRFPNGWMGPGANLQPTDPNHPHWVSCGFAQCKHVQEVVSDYRKTDAGWWLVCKLLGGAQIWVHEEDVPIDNYPNRENSSQFYRRPPRD